MKIYMDVDQLSARFAATPLTYTGKDGAQETVTQILVENGEAKDLDEELPWVRWTVAPGASKRATTGDNPRFKNLGTAFLEIHVPKGKGTKAALEIADSFLSAFEDWKSEDGELYIYKTDTPKGTGTKSSHAQRAVIFYESNRQG
jgi:hypothetical protein